MNLFGYIYAGLLTLSIVFIVWKYEGAINQYIETAEDYKRALSISRHSSNQKHYTHVQLSNAELSRDNDVLKAQINQLKLEIAQIKAGVSEIQYESHTYKANQYVSHYANEVELELEEKGGK